MKIILKHKKTFIVIVIISLLISILPLIGMATFMGVRSSNVNIAYESPVVENVNPIDYQPFDIVVPSEQLPSPVFNSNRFEKHYFIIHFQSQRLHKSFCIRLI